MGATKELKNLVKIHCKAEGPVNFHSIYRYAQEQTLGVLTYDHVAEAILELQKKKVIKKYDSNNWW